MPYPSFKQNKVNFKRNISHLFSVVEPEIENAPAHQIRLWLDKVKLQLMLERNRGVARHYRYDINRHMALAAARNALTLKLKQLE